MTPGSGYNQPLSRLSQTYHEDFLEVAQTRLQPDESIVWAGNVTALAYGYGDHRYKFGYLLVTSYRLILVSFDDKPRLFSPPKEYIVTDAKDSAGNYVDAIGLPSLPLSEKEKRSRIIHEAPLEDVSNVFRTDISLKRQKQATLVHLYVHLRSGGTLAGRPMLFYSIQDGQEVYNILQNAIRRRDMQAQTVPDIADQLAKLAKLYQVDKAITKEEYEAAKRKLLG